MTASEQQRLISEHSDSGLLQILRALAGTACTGSLAVSSADNAGVIFMEDGVVVDALVTDGSWLGEGVPAVAFLTNLIYPELVFSDETDFSQRTIRLDMDHLEELVEQARPLLLPPQQNPEPAAPPPPLEPRADPVEPVATAGVAAEPEEVARAAEAAPDMAEREIAEPEAAAAAAEPGAADHEAVPDPVESALADPEGVPEPAERQGPAAEDLFRGLRGVRGYLAAAIMDAAGSLLAEDSTDEALDPATVGPVFAQIFHLTQETTAEIGLGPCTELTAATPCGTIITRCSDRYNVRALCILAPEGNIALAKLRLDALLPPLEETLQ